MQAINIERRFEERLEVIRRQAEFLPAGKFGTSQMHTHFCIIRREIDAKRLPYTLCDEWYHPGEGRSRYKKYWLVHELEKEVQNG